LSGIVAGQIVAKPRTVEWRSPLLHVAVFGLAAGIFASCAAEPSRPPPTVAVRPLPPALPPPPRAAPRPARKPAPPAGNPAPETGGEALAMTEQKPPEGASRAERAAPQWEEPRALNSGAAAIAPSPQIELIGLDQPAATRLFGPAAEHSEEPPATVWRYKSATCELDLFFYLDLRSGRMRTLHYALKGGGSGPAQRQDCLRSLLASRSG
jgi:hypothetical protein